MPKSTESLSYQQIAQEIIIYLRGTKKQREFSQELGFSFNQVGKWESGVTQIKWIDFIRVCELLKIPIYDHIRLSFWYLDGDFSALSFVRILEKSIQLQKNGDKEILKLVQKWLSKNIEPDLAEVLKVIDYSRGVLIGWLSYFLDCSQLPSLQISFNRLQIAIQAIVENPVAAYINAAIQLDGYKNLTTHDEFFLARHATCTRQELRKILNQMLKVGIVNFDGKKYLPQSSQFFSFAAYVDPKLRGLTKYTLDLLSNRYSLKPVGHRPLEFNYSTCSVRVVPMSAATAKKVGELIAEFNGRMAELVKQDDGPKTNVQLIVCNSSASNINGPEVD